MKNFSPENFPEDYLHKIQRSQHRIENLISNYKSSSSQKLRLKNNENELSDLKEYIQKKISKRYKEFSKKIYSLSPQEKSEYRTKLRIKKTNRSIHIPSENPSVSKSIPKIHQSPSRLYIRQHSESRIPRIKKPQLTSNLPLIPSPLAISSKRPRFRLFK